MSEVASYFTSAIMREFRGYPLYSHLAGEVAKDGDLLALVERSGASGRAAQLLMAVVHFLLLKGRDDSGLARHYASLAEHPLPPEGAFAPFKRFVQANQNDIVAILGSRELVRTDLRRASCLRLLVAEAARQMNVSRINLIDAGCSVGLNLLLDEWTYEYGISSNLDCAGKTPHIGIEARGRAPANVTIPAIVSRTGIDLHLPSLEADDDRLWMLAQVIADDRASFTCLKRLLERLPDRRLRLVAGDVAENLGEVIDSLEAAKPVVVMHSIMLNYLSEAQRQKFFYEITKRAESRPIARVGMEIAGADASLVVAIGSERPQTVGRADIDARWVSWLR